MIRSALGFGAHARGLIPNFKAYNALDEFFSFTFVNIFGYLQTVEYINAWLGMENLFFKVLTWSKVR